MAVESEEQISEVAGSVQQLRAEIEQLRKQVAASTVDPNALNLLVFESHRDRVLAALVMATGAAAMGMRVSMFFSFWATPLLRSKAKAPLKKDLVERMFGWMLPSSLGAARLSRMEMFGIGRLLMGREMKRKRIADLDELLEMAADLGVEISVCEMSMKLMGIRQEELLDYPNLQLCGVAKFMDQAATANTTLFI